MKAAEFKDWIKSIERMSRGQRDKLRERLERKAGADTIIELIEQRQNDERICPYCQGTELYRWGKASELGQHHLPRAARKRGGKAAKRGTSKEQIPVLVIRDRHGETADCILRGTNAEQIESGLMPLLSKDVILCTDGMPAYRQITRNAKIVHRPVSIAAGQRVINDVYHIQNVNAYGSRLRLWIAKFHGVATRYLASYLGWHRMIDHLGQNVTPTLCFQMSLGKTRQFQQLITT